MRFLSGFASTFVFGLGLATCACSSAEEGAPPIDSGVRPDAGEGSWVARIVGEERPRFGTFDEAQLERMVHADPDGPFYMLNLIAYRERAAYRDGRETALTGREADALYAPLDILAEVGAAPVFVAEVENNLPLGDGTAWDQVAIVRYPSRAAFLEMLQRQDYRERAVHKDAGVEKSIVMVAEEIDTPLPDGYVPPEPRYPPTPEDSSFEMVHLMRFRETALYESGADEPERTGKEAVEVYQRNAGTVAAPMGVYPVAWFGVEGVLIGDGRAWDELRINHFPSHATFDALTSDATWEAGRHHREAGLEDTYALQTLPLIHSVE